MRAAALELVGALARDGGGQAGRVFAAALGLGLAGATRHCVAAGVAASWRESAAKEGMEQGAQGSIDVVTQKMAVIEAAMRVEGELPIAP